MAYHSISGLQRLFLYPLPIWDKIHRHRIYTVPRVRRSEMLSREDMPKMGTTISALDFRPHTIGIWEVFYSSGDFVVKAWPSAARLKFALGTVKFRSTALTHISALIPERIVFACERHLSAFMHNNLLLFGSQLLRLDVRRRQINTKGIMWFGM